MTVVLTSYWRPRPGGLCRRLQRTMEALLARGHTLHYLAVEPFPVTHPACHFHRFPWPAERACGLLFWALFHLIAPWLLLWIGWRYRVERLFAFAPTYALLLQPLRRLRRLPLALFLRADLLENHQIKGRPHWLIWLEQWLEGMAMSGVSLHGVSRTLTATVSGRHPGRVATASTLPNDLPPRVTSPSPPQSPLRLACVGVLEGRKGQLSALELLARLPPAAARLTLYGDGPDRPILMERAETLGITDRVTFAGWVSAAEIWSSTDLLLFPSRHEGAPNAVLEAIAHGIPVIASDLPEHREILPIHALCPIGQMEVWDEQLRPLWLAPSATLAAWSQQQSAHATSLSFDWESAVVKRIMNGGGDG